jgi:hypothetical protein
MGPLGWREGREQTAAHREIRQARGQPLGRRQRAKGSKFQRTDARKGVSKELSRLALALGLGLRVRDARVVEYGRPETCEAGRRAGRARERATRDPLRGARRACYAQPGRGTRPLPVPTAAGVLPCAPHGGNGPAAHRMHSTAPSRTPCAPRARRALTRPDPAVRSTTPTWRTPMRRSCVAAPSFH